MTVFMLLLELLACYFPAVAGARGRGSRKFWIGLIFVGLLAGVTSTMLVRQLVGTFDPVVLFSGSEGESFGLRMTVKFLAVIGRASISFCFGSFLAVLLYKKRQAASPSLLGLGK